MPFILPQKPVRPCTIDTGPGLKSVKIKFYSPSSSPLSFLSPMIAILILLHMVVASWQTLHHSGTWAGGVSTPGSLLHWDSESSQ